MTIKKRTKKYKQRDQSILPICYSLPRAAKTDLALTPHACIVALANGAGCEDNVYTLANALNLGALLAQSRSTAVQQVMSSGQDAIISVIKRGESGKWGFSGTEYNNIRHAISLSDDMQQLSTRRELRDAITQLMINN